MDCTRSVFSQRYASRLALRYSCHVRVTAVTRAVTLAGVWAVTQGWQEPSLPLDDIMSRQRPPILFLKRWVTSCRFEVSVFLAAWRRLFFEWDLGALPMNLELNSLLRSRLVNNLRTSIQTLENHGVLNVPKKLIFRSCYYTLVYRFHL